MHPSEEFNRRYGNDFRIIFTLSAKVAIFSPEIVGPLVYRKSKDVEYSIFIPHDGSDAATLSDYTTPIRNFIVGVTNALERLELDTSELRNNMDSIVKEITTDASIFKMRSHPI